MAQKTVPTIASVAAFVATLDPAQQADSQILISLLEELSGSKAVMWGNIIGFGQYEYQYTSGHKGYSMCLGFAPRTGKISLYVGAGAADNQPLLENLGKFQMAKSCLYVKRVADINLDILAKICNNRLGLLEREYPSNT